MYSGMPRCLRASAAGSECRWQERQSNCVKLLPPLWHELQVIGGESEPSACFDPAAMGKNESCVVGSSMVLGRAELLPPMPHAAARVSRANGSALQESRMAPAPSSTASASAIVSERACTRCSLAENVSCGGDRSPAENCNRSPRRGRAPHLLVLLHTALQIVEGVSDEPPTLREQAIAEPVAGR